MDVLKTSESEMVMYSIVLNVDGISGRIFKAIDCKWLQKFEFAFRVNSGDGGIHSFEN